MAKKNKKCENIWIIILVLSIIVVTGCIVYICSPAGQHILFPFEQFFGWNALLVFLQSVTTVLFLISLLVALVRRRKKRQGYSELKPTV